MHEHWLILGGTSSIARAFTRQVAAAGAHVTVAGRDLDDLKATAADAKLRGAASARVLECDATSAASCAACVANAPIPGTTLNVMVAMGSMPAQEEMCADARVLTDMVQSTYLGPVMLVEGLVSVFLQQKRGCIILVGSVAGDRGRLKNYLYGSAKAALATFADGLRARFFQARTVVSVTLVKPGFIDTAMTWGLPGLFLVASPQDCARAALRASRRGASVLYFPAFWRWIMLVIRHIPAGVMKRLAF